MKKLLQALIVTQSLACFIGAQTMMLPVVNTKAAGGAPPTPVSAVHVMTGAVGFASGSSTATMTFPNSAVSGNWLEFYVILNHGNATVTITSLTGAGCPSSFGTAVINGTHTANNALGIWAWAAQAAGSGTCAVNLDAGGFFSNWDRCSGEFANTSGIERFGSAANNSASTLAITASGATAVTGDYATVCWGANAASGSAAASGWTSDFNSSTLGGFHQSGISSGVTPSFSGSPISNGSAENIGGMLVLKP